MSASSRIKTPNELASLIESAKEQGKKVVTTNGVYDFIHAGHLEYLEEARALGDMLVILLNSDESVHRIKGPTRPINNEQDRALILAGLRCVDYVTLFNEDDPASILDKLKPSLHAKGGDYDPEKMPETKIVRQNGGDVRILKLKAGYSNTNQFAKIKAAAEAEEEKSFTRPEWLTNAQIKK
ncbi:MAG: adenylyltransferase/cytidyltransferase family protein [Pseudobdellovibrionaceae bacterium]